MKTLQWFINRIGKRIYRNSSNCPECATCKDVEENGMIIEDESHAEYLFNIQNDFGACNVFLNYRDTKNATD